MIRANPPQRRKLQANFALKLVLDAPRL